MWWINTNYVPLAFECIWIGTGSAWMLAEASQWTAPTCAYSVATTWSTDAQRLWKPAAKKNHRYQTWQWVVFSWGAWLKTEDVPLPGFTFTINGHAACQFCRFCSTPVWSARSSVIWQPGSTGRSEVWSCPQDGLSLPQSPATRKPFQYATSKWTDHSKTLDHD